MTPLQSNAALIRVYLFFRFALVIILAVTFLYSPKDRFLGNYSPDIFVWTAITYFFICLITLVLTPIREPLRRLVWVYVSLCVDVFCMVLFLHASGGLDSSLSYLLLVFIAISGIFVQGRLGFGFAALTSLLVMGESLYITLIEDGNQKSIFSAGTLGILIFATTYAFQLLSEKIHSSNLEAERQANYAKHLQKLAQSIIKRMRTGILVVDERGSIELVNESALQLLDLPLEVDYRDVNIHEITALSHLVEQRLENQNGAPPTVMELRAGQEARVSLSILNLGEASRTVIYLEDHRVLTQQAQQLKLASLGRLTASIAHEVRNPLGAISHAAQLLAESEELPEQDKRLTDIIQQHSQRVNHIVESTLSMSRRKEPQAEILNLTQWLPKFISQYSTGQRVKIDLDIEYNEHMVKIDPTHLSQVLTNLLDNGIRYSEFATGRSEVQLVVRQSKNDDTHYIDVIDFGEGISKEKILHIFDPFFTTDKKGSGLGLYISKELCEINQATLHYRRTEQGQSCFRIEFSHHQRMF